MDQPISAAEANRSFSGLLRAVRQGQGFVVTAHGRPVARIAPCNDDADRTKRLAGIHGASPGAAGDGPDRPPGGRTTNSTSATEVRVALDTNLLACAAGLNGSGRQAEAIAVLESFEDEEVVTPVQALGELFAVLTLRAADRRSRRGTRFDPGPSA